MACDYKESCSKVCTPFWLALWAFPLLLVMHPMHSTQETAFANDPMHACDTRIHLLARCSRIERLAENPQHCNQSTADVYWNTSANNRNLTKSETSQNQPPIGSHPIWMLMMCCMTIILDDLIPALTLKLLRHHEAEICKPVRNRTTFVASPFLRVCMNFLLLVTCIAALRQGMPIWNLPVIDGAPKHRKRRWDASCNQGFPVQGVFLRSSCPQQLVRTHTTIGDGNCFWRAAARNLPIKWYTLKHDVLRSALQSSANLDNKEVKHLLKKNQWANSVAIQLTAKFLGCNLAIWHRGGIGFFPSPNQNANTTYLSLSNHHFESMPAKTGMKLLASCDPYSPIPIQALSYCTKDDYPEATTIPCRTLKMCRIGFFERYSFAPPNSLANPKNIGIGLPPREKTQQNRLASPLKQKPLHHPRKRNSQRTGLRTRTSWPAWYLLVIFGLHCLGTKPEHYEQHFPFDHQPSNLSAYTSSETFQEGNFRQHDHMIPATPQLHVNQISDDAAAFCKHCIVPVADPSNPSLSADSCSQDVSAVQLQHDLDAVKAPTQQHCRDFLFRVDPFGNSSFWGGYCFSIRGRKSAMVISRAEVELEQRIRSLRSELDTDDSVTSPQERQQLNNRYQNVMRALLTKRIARSRSRTPIQRRTRRELNRLMRGSESGLREAPPHAALEQHRGVNENISQNASSSSFGTEEARPLQPSEPVSPPPWRRQLYIETWGSSPQRPMTPSTFDGLAQARIDIRLHDHNDPGRDPYLRKHVGLHCTTLLRHAQHIEIQKALACTLRIANSVQSVHVSICCTQGRHRSVAFSECLRTLIEMQQNHCRVQMHHRAARHNWWRLCQPDRCEECNLHRSNMPDGQAFRDELQQTLGVCFTMDVNEHPYVRAQPAPAYTDCIDAPCCSHACSMHMDAAQADHVQDDDLTDNWGALEHPISSAITAITKGRKKAPPFSLTCPNEFPDPPSPYDQSKEMRGSSGAAGRGYSKVCFGVSFKQFRTILFSWYLLGGFVTNTSSPLCRIDQYQPYGRLMHEGTQSWKCYDVLCKHNLDHQDPKCGLSMPNNHEYLLYVLHPCHNPGNGDGDVANGCNSIHGDCGGFSPFRSQGFPQHPYGDHKLVDCIGAVTTQGCDHCKTLKVGWPYPHFGSIGLLVCKPIHLKDPHYSSGCNGIQEPDDADSSGYNRTAEAVQNASEISGSHVLQRCDLVTSSCLCSKVVASKRLKSLKDPGNPPDRTQLCSFHNFENETTILAANYKNTIPLLLGGFVWRFLSSLYNPLVACPVACSLCLDKKIMPPSAAEILIERQMIRLRSDLQHGPIQGEADLLARMQQQHNALEADLLRRREARSRSPVPLRRRSQRELNRLMRQEATPKGGIPAPRAACC